MFGFTRQRGLQNAKVKIFCFLKPHDDLESVGNTNELLKIAGLIGTYGLPS